MPSVAPSSGTGAGTTWGAPPPAGSAAKDLARTTKIHGRSPVNRAVGHLGAAEQSVLGAHVVPVRGQVHDVGDHGRVEPHRQAAGDVTAVVAGGDRG